MQDRIFECSIEVRGYELDAYGHVNHAQYVSYLEHARWKLLQELGIDFAQFEKLGAWPVIASVDMQFLKPCFLGESLVIQTRVLGTSRTSISFEQTIQRGETPVCIGKVRAVMVDKAGRPTSIPQELTRE
jgi:acyl-CoA thioester hydrolase